MSRLTTATTVSEAGNTMSSSTSAAMAWPVQPSIGAPAMAYTTATSASEPASMTVR
ncbi:hypothetical protein D9M68_962090 [compost metagenome]